MREDLLVPATIAGVLLSAATTQAAPITTGSLVREMIDMRRLADFPSPAYKTVQFSSYDHRSNLPGGPEWFANSDGFGNEPVPNFEAVIKQPGADGIGEYLICDVDGPGAIVRVWTAAIEGQVRLFLDGQDQPVFAGSAHDFFRLTWQHYKVPELDDKVLDGTFFQRNAGYYPIPFAKRCRLIWIGDVKKIHFYQIQIRRYEAGTQVETFTPEDLKTYAKEIRRVAQVLAGPDRAWEYTSKNDELPINGEVAPGQKLEVLKLEGPQAVERLTLKLTADDVDRALRQTVMQIICDDYPWGQVQSPVGDFFGAAPGVNPYDSVPFTVRPDGTMISRYVMPFARSLRIVLENRGRQPVRVSGSALPMAYTWNDQRSMHFRARWRVDHDLIGSGEAVQDLPYLIANGQGVYVGTAAMLLNPAPVPTPNGNWWGEGDEKIFVDDDVQPSTFGTGSEDYFNYAWSSPDIFVFPYCGQPRNDGPANRGFVTNNRWHIIDDLPFKQRISFYMELYSHETVPNMSYARIGYHYARPGLMDDHVVITGEDVRHLELPPDWQPAARRGAGNSVFFQAEDLLLKEADPAVQTVANNLWSGGKMLAWKPEESGAQLALKLPIAQDGKYMIHLCVALTPDSGVAAVEVDGKAAGFGGDSGRLDLQVPHRTLSRVVSSRDLQLKAGEHKLTLRSEGGAGNGQPGMIGIDFVWIQKR
ncbi:MAG: hypothetical protein AMXMBFR13_10360 [Phycisphaerae bacterium]